MPLRLRPRQNKRIFPLLRPRIIVLYVALLLMAAGPFVVSSSSSAVLLSYRQLKLSDSTVNATGVKYNFSFNTNTSGPIGSISFEICSNYQYQHGEPCDKSTGFSATGTSLTAQTGTNDFALNPNSTDHVLVVSRPIASPVLPQQLSFEFSGLINPSAVGSSYVRIETHTSTDGSGPEVDYGEVVYATNVGVSISTEVPPYLQFCTGVTIDNYDCSTAAGNFISFGELSSTATRAATSQLVASTNAAYGYSVTLAGTTMTAGNNTIPAMTGSPSRIGSSQFGINSRHNNTPNVGSEPQGPGLTTPSGGYNTPNQYRFNNGDIIASSNDSDDYRKLTVTYLVNSNGNQPAGRYVATISYICLANF